MRIRFDVILIVIILPLIGVGLFLLSKHQHLLEEVAELDRQGWELYRANDFNGAERLFAETVSKMPTRNSGYLGMGWCRWAVGSYDDAEKWFMDAANIDDSKGYHHHGIAEIHHRRGDLDKAVEHYRLAIKADNTNPNYHLGMGWVCKSMGNMEQAAQSFKQVVSLTEKKKSGQMEVDLKRMRDEAFAGLHEVEAKADNP